MKTQHIVVLGGGTMGFALASRILAHYSVSIIEKFQQRREYITATLPKAHCFATMHALEKPADLIVLAIKPQEFAQIAATLPKDTWYLSVLAGIPLQTLSSKLRSEKVARIMPSLTATIGKAVTGYCTDPENTKDSAFVSLTQSVAAHLGTLIEVPESLIPAITALSGSGIAFIFRFMHDLAMAGAAEGIAYPNALSIVHEVVLGAAAYAKEQYAEGTSPVDLITKVCSPAGTTIAGIQALDAAGFSTAIQRAVTAVTRRSVEMESAL